MGATISGNVISDSMLIALVMAAFASAPLAGWLGKKSSPFVSLIPLALFIWLCALLPAATAGLGLLQAQTWIPSLGINAAFRLDGLSITFALLITGIGSAVFLYASAYMEGGARLARFYTVLTLFMASMIGAVLADDIMLLVVFWELTSLTSFLLIGYYPEQAKTRRSAQQGFLTTVGGGLAMLAGVILLGSVADTFSLSLMLERSPIIVADPLAPVIVVLIAIGAFAKSAQMPLHTWLPNAMVAPTPVSAFLHSATMVKLGIYLLARLDPVLGGLPIWVTLLTLAGAITMMVGAVLALRETDLKKVLAYSTVVSLGTLVMMIGTPGTVAAIAVITFLIVHALYKACLFLIAGIVDFETGTRDSTSVSGLRRHMPLTAAIAFLGGLSMAGLPPFIGFAAKELVYEAGLLASASWILVTAALVANITMVVIAGIVALKCFWGKSSVTAETPPSDPPWPMLAGPAVLAMLGLFFGVAPWVVGESLIVPAASAIAGRDIDYSLSLWHGFTPMLGLSMLTFLLGTMVLRRWDGLRDILCRLHFIERWGPDRFYDLLMAGLNALAIWQTRLLQTASLRVYLIRTFAVIGAGVLLTLVLRNGIAMPSFQGAMVPEAVLAFLTILSALAVATARNFVAGLVAAGMVGFTLALLFLFQGAPDLAFTQFSIEALSIVIFLAIVGHMPFRDSDYRTVPQRRRDAALAIALGVTASLVLLAVLAQPLDQYVSDFYRAASVPEAHGRNLVNVILVDFRALDTFGEIAVLGLAALAAAAVVAGVRRQKRELQQ
jgi:multicomponent Na+:H+ antiporter subunit A